MGCEAWSDRLDPGSERLGAPGAVSGMWRSCDHLGARGPARPGDVPGVLRPAAPQPGRRPLEVADLRLADGVITQLLVHPHHVAQRDAVLHDPVGVAALGPEVIALDLPEAEPRFLVEGELPDPGVAGAHHDPAHAVGPQ